MSFIFIGVYKNTRTRIACYRTITIFCFEEAKKGERDMEVKGKERSLLIIC